MIMPGKDYAACFLILHCVLLYKTNLGDFYVSGRLCSALLLINIENMNIWIRHFSLSSLPF
jgi:hypothetical protein